MSPDRQREMNLRFEMRLPIVGVLTACVVAGSLFAPVFGLAAVLWPTLAVAVVVYVVEEAILRRPDLVRWRVPLTVAGGFVALAVVVPGAVQHPMSLWNGVTSGWRSTLESTWPTRPDPELVTFVPALVLLACLVGVRLLAVSRAWSIVPPIVVAGFAQAYVTVSGVDALLAGAALVGCSCLVLLRWPDGRVAWLRLVAALAAMAVGATILGTGLPDRAAAHLPRPSPPDIPSVLSNPLTEIGARLRSPDKVVFTVRADAPVDRWSMVTLDSFDGVTWSADLQFQRLGRELPLDSRVTVSVERRAAEISLVDWSLPWLPSQSRTLSVADVPPLLVEPAYGTLLSDQALPSHYRLTWADPMVGTDQLSSAGVARLPDQVTTSDLGKVPPAIDQLAREIAGDLRPSFQTALVLENYLRTHYRVATGGALPTGHGYPQLSNFLLQSKRGTSEQFAASYVVLARLLGLQARLAVGFRQPAGRRSDGLYVVRNGDILAWPEVAVEGVGWVPLDPTGTAASAGRGASLAEVAESVRRSLPPMTELEREHRAEPVEPAARSDGDLPLSLWWNAILVVAMATALIWLAGVPLVKAVRRFRRRRRGTLGAWAEARDLLRDNGIRVSASMTARDLARNSAGSVSQALTVLAGCLDTTLWSGQNSDPDSELAWTAVREARHGLIQGTFYRRLRLRLRMTLSARSLFG